MSVHTKTMFVWQRWEENKYNYVVTVLKLIFPVSALHNFSDNFLLKQEVVMATFYLKAG